MGLLRHYFGPRKKIRIYIQIKLNGIPSSDPFPIDVEDGQEVTVEQPVILEVLPKDPPVISRRR